MSNRYTVYGREKPACPHCIGAKSLLESKTLEYEYIDVIEGNITPGELSKMAGQAIRTVPVIFHNGTFIGGFKDLQRHLATS